MLRSLALAIIVAVTNYVPEANSSPLYQVVDLGIAGRHVDRAILGGDGSTVITVTPGINPEEMPGKAYLSPGTDLGSLGGNRTFANGINVHGSVVGGATIADGTTHAFLYEDSNLIDLGPFGENGGFATSISDSGHITGVAFNANGSESFLRHVNGDVEFLGSLGGLTVNATDVNSNGEVVGAATIAFGGSTRGFFWKDGGIFPLATLGGRSSTANAINNHSVIVGGSTNIVGETHATLFGVGLQPIDLGIDGAISVATDINNLGMIVGQNDFTDGLPEAALFSLDAEPLRLQDLTAGAEQWERFLVASGINDDGIIVGQGVREGDLRGFVLLPIPEPSTLGLITLGLLTLPLQRCRRR